MADFCKDDFKREQCLYCKTFQWFEQVDDVVNCPHCDAYLLMYMEEVFEWIETLDGGDNCIFNESEYYDSYTIVYLEKVIHEGRF